MRERLRLLVIDDEEVVTVGLRVLLCRHPWVERCLQATDGRSGLALVRRYNPHVAIVGLSLGDMSAVQLSERLRLASPSTHVLLMASTERLPSRTVAAARASGFISKHWSADEMIAAIRVGALGVQITNGGSPVGAGLLTAREEDVLAHIARGATNPEIARALDVSLHTVKQHASAAYRKLKARNRMEAVERARRIGLIG